MPRGRKRTRCRVSNKGPSGVILRVQAPALSPFIKPSIHWDLRENPPQTGVSAFWACLSFENMNGWFPWARSRWDLEPRPEADPTVELCLRHPGQVYTPLQEAGRGSRGTAGLHRAEAAEPRVWAGLSHRTGRHWPRLLGASSCCAGSASTSLWHIIVRSDAVISALSHCFTAEGQSRAAPTPRPLCISSKALGASPLPGSPRRHTSRKRDIF